MSKCQLDIKKDIIDTVGDTLKEAGAFVEGNAGYFPNPRNATPAINSINKEFKTLIVQEGEKGSFFIEPSDELVQQYYNEYVKGLSLTYLQEEEEPAALLQQEEMLRGGYTEEQRGEFFQVSSKEIEEGNKQLDDYLLNFLKPFGVTSKEVEVLKNRLGEDSLGVADVLNKLITLAKNRKIDTVPEEAGHMLVMLMGEDHPEIKGLLRNIEKWSGYQEVYDEYFDRYYNEKQIKIEAIGKVIAKSLVREFKESAVDKSIFYQARKAIEAFFRMLGKLNPFYSNSYTYHLADKIAKNVLLGNTEYVASLTKPNPKLDYSKAIENNSLAKLIIDIFTGQGFGFKLTGSLAIAGQGEPIYRPESEPIHDLDFVVDDKSKREQLSKFLDSVNAVPVHYGIKGDDYTTIAYHIPKEGYTVEVTERTNYGMTKKFQVRDANGKIVEATAENVIDVDFFIYNVPSKEQEAKSMFSSWQDIYKGKLSLSPLKSGERMFARKKDQADYVLSVPVSRDVELAQFTYLQSEGMPASRAAEATLDRVKEVAKRMGVDIQALTEYAKQNPDMDVKSVNGVADLVKGVIAIAEGKEDVALTEEMVHIATAILEQTNPALVTEMISKIGNFKIYKQVFEAYKNNPRYQINGKPNIRKIKKEAVDKLIAEVIINNNEGSTEFPELMEEENQSWVRRTWNKILNFFGVSYRKADINIFQEAAVKIMGAEPFGTVDSVVEGDIYLQITDAQKSTLEKIQYTKNNLNKVVEKPTTTDPVLLDSEEANNYYEIKLPDGRLERVLKRVTDRVKAWYKSRFGAKVFSEQEKKFNELKRKYGIQGHSDLEEIHNRYYNPDGTKRVNPLARPTKINLPSMQMYDKLEKYFTDLIATLPNGTLVLSEVIVYDPKNKEAGTIDFLAIDPNGKGHILDWKFMNISGDDVAWFKQGAFNIQLRTYKDILREQYGIKEFGMVRAIPISMEFKKEDPKDPNSDVVLGGIAIGSVNKSDIEDLRLVPVSEESESTGFPALDAVIAKLNALLKQYSKEEATTDEEREFKVERLNTLRKAIRYAQGTMNIAPLIDVIEVMRKDGDRILEDYNTTYKNRPITSNDSTDSELSDFAEEMNNYIKFSEVFVNIGREIGDLIYTEQMMKEARTDEEFEAVEERRAVLEKLNSESNRIFKSQKEIKEASMNFADKHVGQRNLVTGLLKPEAVVKGLSSLFRGISELPLKSLQILYKLTRAAQGRASQDALEEVNQIMKIREKIVKKGGDVRRFVQKMYQKDTEGGLVNKLIHKYSREFHDKVDSLAEAGGDKDWLMQNIDVEGYRKEAKVKMENQIARIKRNRYSGTPEEEEEQREKYILQAKRLWDIDREDFNGWNNYIIKRHPQSKWYSKEYREVASDPDLLELYNFIVNFNQKANDVGYIRNAVTKTFLPFVRKSMAEELVWDNTLSPMKQFSEALSTKSDDVGLGKINEITGELENSVPKYFTYDFTRKEDGTNDYSEVSEDLFKNMILYVQHVNKYKYMTEIEGQLKLVKTIEEFKGHLNTKKTGEVILKDGVVDVKSGNEENTKMFNDFLRVLLYDQKYVLSDSDTPLAVGKVLNFVRKSVNQIAGREIWKENEGSPTSLVKSMDAANRAFQLKTLGFEFISGAVNAFGGNIQVATQAGNYFKAREFAANEVLLTLQNFKSESEKEMFVQLVNTFMPLKDDPSYEEYKKAGMSKLTRGSLSDTLMVFMRKPEQLIEKSIFLSLLQNMMVVDGRIVSIAEHVRSKYKDRYKSGADYKEAKGKIEAEIKELKKTKSLFVTKKLENGELVIPGLDLTNRNELQRLTNLTRRISRNATGGFADGDMNRMSMSIWTKSMMIFKNWIPKLLDTRFSEFRKISDDFSVVIDESTGQISGEKYDIGRIRLLGSVLGRGIIKGAIDLRNILVMNDSGIAAVDELFEKFRKKYEDETGEKLTMTREDFMDLIRTNLRNQMKELMILVTMLSTYMALGFIAPDDDDDADRATKNAHRYSQKVLDKFVGELSFFYNPLEFQRMLSGSAFPAIGLTSDIIRFTKHLGIEMTGMDFDPKTTDEEAREKAKPMKYLFKMLPVTKSALTYLSIFDADFAKEYDITIQRESR